MNRKVEGGDKLVTNLRRRGGITGLLIVAVRGAVRGQIFTRYICVSSTRIIKNKDLTPRPAPRPDKI